MLNTFVCQTQYYVAMGYSMWLLLSLAQYMYVHETNFTSIYLHDDHDGDDNDDDELHLSLSLKQQMIQFPPFNSIRYGLDL